MTGPAGIAAVLALVFLAVFLVGYFLVGTGMRFRRDREVAQRMLAVGRPSAEASSIPVERTGWIPPTMALMGSKVAGAGGFGERLEQQLEQAGLGLKSGEFIVVTVLATLGGGILAALLLPNALFDVLLAIVAGLVPIGILRLALARRARRLQNQLADVLTIMASSLRAGHSFFQALDTVSKEINEPAASEFSRVVAEVRLGRPVEDALEGMSERVGSQDFKWAVLAVNIQREVGGNLAEILDRVAETIRERAELRGRVDVLTTEGRLSAYVLIALPFVIALYMAVVSPEYLGLLITTFFGKIMLAVAASLMVIGIFWMRKIVRIDV